MSKARGVKTRKDRQPPPRPAEASKRPPGRGSSGERDDEPGSDDAPPGRFGRTTTTGTAGGPKSEG